MNDARALKGLESWKIVFPIVIGLGATSWLMAREYSPEAFDAVRFTGWTVVWLVVSCLLMATRDVGYMIRIRLLSERELTWRQAFRIIMLWEFSSAVTPSAVGGTSVALFFVNREGINAGRSTAIVMTTSFLDELFFAIVFPIVVLLIGHANVFGLSNDATSNFAYLAWTGYAVKLAYIIVLSYGLFGRPEVLKKMLVGIFRLPLLRRWQHKAEQIGDDLVTASVEFRHWSLLKWTQAFAATVASWIARYWVVNTLVIAFFGIGIWDLGDHMIVFGKQLAMWIMMLVSPTPGGSGFAEWVFKEFLGGILPVGAGVALALCWRLVSYYPYLVIGAVIVPRWVKRIINKD